MIKRVKKQPKERPRKESDDSRQNEREKAGKTWYAQTFCSDACLGLGH